METPEIKITHGGIEITYDERRNLFCFELRGRCRTADSLAKARAAIDAPPPKEKKPFTRFKAWKRDSLGWSAATYIEVEVTSITEGGGQVWISTPDKKYSQRSKVPATSVYPRNEKNDAIVAEWKERQERVKALEDEQSKTVKKLKAYEIPEEE